MSTRGRLVALMAAAAVLSLVAAACGTGEQPTPIYVYTNVPSVTPAPTPTPTPVPTETPAPSSSASASPSASPSATPTPTPAPAGSVVPGAACSGSAGIKTSWASISAKMKFKVYCPVLGSGWGVKVPLGLAWGTPRAGGWVTVEYLNNHGGDVILKEGNYGANVCATSTGSLGTASFDGMTGNFYTIAGGFALCVNPGTTTAYEISATGVTQAAFQTYAGAVAEVPKA